MLPTDLRSQRSEAQLEVISDRVREGSLREAGQGERTYKNKDQGRDGGLNS